NEVLSSNLSCSSLEIRAVNAEISSALDVKLNSVLSTKEA
ncbi:11334_t:CDS:1, partial [Paraglomus brasilianum]